MKDTIETLIEVEGTHYPSNPEMRDPLCPLDPIYDLFRPMLQRKEEKDKRNYCWNACIWASCPAYKQERDQTD